MQCINAVCIPAITTKLQLEKMKDRLISSPWKLRFPSPFALKAQSRKNVRSTKAKGKCLSQREVRIPKEVRREVRIPKRSVQNYWYATTAALFAKCIVAGRLRPMHFKVWCFKRVSCISCSEIFPFAEFLVRRCCVRVCVCAHSLLTLFAVLFQPGVFYSWPVIQSGTLPKHYCSVFL